jgi:hypothetical protein
MKAITIFGSDAGAEFPCSKQSASQPAILLALFSLDSVERSGSRAKRKRMCSKRLRRSRLRSRPTRMPLSPWRQELQNQALSAAMQMRT